MTQHFDIRVLRPEDLSLMRDLIGMFAKAFGDPQTYLGNQPSDAYLSDLLGKSHFIAIAATMDEFVVGGLAAYQLDKFEQDRREIYLYDLAVDEGYRRRGIATATIEALRAEAVRRDADVVFVQADLEDAPAIALYEKLGVKKTAHHFDIEPRSSKSRPKGD
jgi:aminoglycoside 3-N-acetyltransferase I